MRVIYLNIYTYSAIFDTSLISYYAALMRIISKKNVVMLVCRKSLQGVMNKLYLLGLTGMNYGNANTLGFEDTGEKNMIRYLAKATGGQEKFIFFDVGANTGDYSRLLYELMQKKNLSIYAFEPSAYTFSLLAKNAGTIKNINLFNYGVGDKEETVTIYSNYETSGAATLYNKALENYTFNKNLTEQVKIKTLDDICFKESVGSIDFLKIDVEGHEYKVLLGAQKLLASRNIKFIQFEFGPFNVYSKTYFKYFWDLLSPSYKIYRIIRNGFFEIPAYSENLEIFRTSNFLAALKTLK